MILLDAAHQHALDMSGDIKTVGTKANVALATIPESAFNIAGINADYYVGKEGSLFQRIGIDGIRSMIGRPNLSLFLAPLALDRQIRPGQKKALRVHLGGVGDARDCAFLLYRAGAPRSPMKFGDTTDRWGWQWMRFEYGANNYLRWITDQGGVAFAGYIPNGEPVFFSCAASRVGSIFTLDVGRDGSACLDGYDWV